jgi:hypothetical protein
MDHLRFVISSDLAVTFSMSPAFSLVLLALGVAFLIWNLVGHRLGIWRRLEIDGAVFGLGDQKISLRPNITDMQVAYRIWVELSTRKIGLPILLEDDVLVEVYDSWYSFFAVTRELIKEVPVSRFRRADTEKIIRLSIDVLNLGIRPHLTKWQARFRHWYERELERSSEGADPQEIQKRFPQYDELVRDLEVVNQRLIKYREQMYTLISRL